MQQLVKKAGASRLAVLTLACFLQSCVYVPRTVQLYDRDCQAFARHMVLEEVQVASINRCANEGCVALIVGASAVTAVTAIVSGTIVLAGNVVYWFERRAQCLT